MLKWTQYLFRYGMDGKVDLLTGCQMHQEIHIPHELTIKYVYTHTFALLHSDLIIMQMCVRRVLFIATECTNPSSKWGSHVYIAVQLHSRRYHAHCDHLVLPLSSTSFSRRRPLVTCPNSTT